jgi:integrase
MNLQRGRNIKDYEMSKKTLAELIDRYIEEVLPEKKESYQKKSKMILLYWKKQLGVRLLKDITPSLLSNHKNILLKEANGRATKNATSRTGSTVNRYMAYLSVVFTKAYKEWEWMSENPMLKVEKCKEAKGRTRFLSEEEQKNLLNACKESTTPLLYLLVILALSTGARYGELLNLKWENVKFDNKEKKVTLYLMNTKNGDNKNVELNGYPYSLLKEHSKIRNINTKYIFARPDGKKPYDLRTQWENARDRAGLVDFRFHDLRHTTASNLAMNGASLRDIAEILGHKTMQMTKRYSHLTEKYSAKVLADMNAKQFQNIEK